jgi:hypothetical protein
LVVKLKKNTPFTFKLNKNAKIKAQSLILLNVNALNALFKVVILFVQKLINKNEVTPINSQPKINVTQLPAHNNKIMDKTKHFKKKKKLIIFNSNLI